MLVFGNETCEDVHNFPQNARCAFVLNVSDCGFDDGFIQYIQLIYCAGSEAGLYGGLVLMFLWCLVLLLLLASVADEFFGPSLVVIAKLLHFSDNLAGVTLLALGNGAADIFSAIAAGRNVKAGDAGLMYGSLLGAGILVTTVTTACVALVKPFRTQRRPIIKDIIFYILAVVWNLSIMIKGFIHFAEALGFIILYIVYVSITVISRTIRNRMMKKEEEEEEEAKKSAGRPKFDRRHKISRVAGPGVSELQLTSFRRLEEKEEELSGVDNAAYASETRMSTVHEEVPGAPRLAIPPRDVRASSNATSTVYDDTMGHTGIQRVEGVATRRVRQPVERSRSKRVSQYHGLTKKLSMRQQLLGRPPSHRGPRPSYLTQWVMAYRREDDEAMIPSPDPRDMRRQRSRSHMEIQRDIHNMAQPLSRARAATTGAAPSTIPEKNGFRITDYREGKFVEVDLVNEPPLPADVDGPDTGLRAAQSVDQLREDEIDGEEEEETYEVPGLFMHFVETINPIDAHVWQSLSIFWKIFEVIRSPIRFLLTIIIPLVDYDHPTQGWCKLLKMVQCFTTPLFWIFAIQVFTTELGGVMPMWALMLLVGVLLASIIFFTSKHDEPPKYHFLFAFFGFATSIICIYSITNEVVNILPTFGVVFKISKAVLALTFLAWANSVGDIMSNTILAKNNFPRIAISACFGGPLFNLLLGIGIPFSMLTSDASKGFRFDMEVTMVQLILVIFLLITLVSHLVFLFIFRFNVKRYYGAYFILVYITFVTVAILSELNIIPSFNL